MNLVLLRAGYPAIAVRPLDRAAHVEALGAAQAGLDDGLFVGLLYGRLNEALDQEIEAYRAAGG